MHENDASISPEKIYNQFMIFILFFSCQTTELSISEQMKCMPTLTEIVSIQEERDILMDNRLTETQEYKKGNITQDDHLQRSIEWRKRETELQDKVNSLYKKAATDNCM